MQQVHLRSSAPTGSPRRIDGSEKRLHQAAEAGDADAQCNLGILYDNGTDDNGRAVEGSRPQAVKWLLAAAEQDLPRAQLKLAELYANGPDISGNRTAACGWFLLAATGLRGVHLRRARLGYELVASQLGPTQIAAAHAFARDRTVKHTKRTAGLGSPTNHAGGRAS